MMFAQIPGEALIGVIRPVTYQSNHWHTRVMNVLTGERYKMPWEERLCKGPRKSPGTWFQ